MEFKKATTQSELFSITLIRAEVFMCEQNVDPLIELDKEDKTCHHYLLTEKEEAVGCLRIIDQGNSWYLGRIAILNKFRKQHYGSFLLQQVELLAKQNKIKKLILGAQVQAVSFYEKNGFISYGEPYEEANITHIHMEKVL